jgi:gentisate 1,2-dioxygenase
MAAKGVYSLPRNGVTTFIIIYSYVIASGSGTFYKEGAFWKFKSGDFIFVAAGAEHRFEDFTDDFATWVFFYGPIGGEGNT